MAGAALLGFGAATLIGRSKPAPALSFKRLTFQRGNLLSARFAPGGDTVVYAAAWEGKPAEIYSTQPKSPEFRALGIPNAELLAISPTGELAISLRQRNLMSPVGEGTLATVPMAGGSPRPVLDDVESADWSPDGKQLAVIRTATSHGRLEYPVGTLRYESKQMLRRVRIAPDGKRIAFLEGSPGGWTVNVLEPDGAKRALTQPYTLINRVVWHPSGREIWFDGEEMLRTVTLSGKDRIRFSAPVRIVLHDVSAAGHVLIERGEGRQGVIFGGPEGERELGGFDSADLVGLLPNGAGIVFNDRGAGGGRAFYLRRSDGSPAIRLGEGYAHDVSPDGLWVLAMPSTQSDRLALFPTGTGTSRVLPHASLEDVGPGTFLPDGKRIILIARRKGEAYRSHIQDLAGGESRPLLSPGFYAPSRSVSPDGKWVAVVRGASEPMFLAPLDGGPPRPVPGSVGEVSVGWTADGSRLFAFGYGNVPARLHRVDPFTGRRELWKVLSPPDLATIYDIDDAAVSADGRFYAYDYNRVLTSDLFLVEGLQ